MTLTLKQEKFCQGVAKGLSYSDAYRSAYNASNTKDNVINVRASELMANGKIAVRVKELRERALKRYDLTVDDMISELEEARDIAKRTKQCAPMVSATMGKAKLLGLIVDTQDIRIKKAPVIKDDI